MLHSRIGAILEYLSSVQQGKIAPDQETLRQISSLVSSITAKAPSEKENATLDVPAATTSAGLSAGLGSEFEQEQNDVMLMSLLNSMTKNLDEVNMLVDKFGIVHSKEYGRGGDEEMYGQGRRGGLGHRKGIPGDPGRRHGRRNVDGSF